MTFINPAQVRAVRGYFDKSQSEFAAKVGIARSTLAAHEQGLPLTANVNDKIVAYCTEFGVEFKKDGFVIQTK